jgi:tRNA/tmRNA/rRNA uracil-C5-methylase (TrmA/RlmC/RlmD family)
VSQAGVEIDYSKIQPARFCMQPVQAKLNIDNRSRTSFFPWRGQFSPELIEHIIDTFCPHADVLADPFCGSGTVLLESMRIGRAATGIDINPAAYVLSSFCKLLRFSKNERAALASDICHLLDT